MAICVSQESHYLLVNNQLYYSGMDDIVDDGKDHRALTLASNVPKPIYNIYSGRLSIFIDCKDGLYAGGDM